MSHDVMSKEELLFLSKRNKELVVMDLMSDEKIELIQTRIQSALVQCPEQNYSLELKQYETKNGLELSLDAAVNYFALTVSLSKESQHLMLVPFQEFVKVTGLSRETLNEDVLLEKATHWFMTFLTNYYESFVGQPTLEVIQSKVGKSSELQELFEFDQLIEVKRYELKTVGMDSLEIIHLSDLSFLETVYTMELVDHSSLSTIEKVDADDQSEEMPSPVQLKEDYPMKNEENKILNSNVTLDQVARPQFQQLDSDHLVNSEVASPIDMFSDLKMKCAAILGYADLSVAEVRKLRPGSVILLDRETTDAIDIVIQGRGLAKAEVVTVEEYFGFRITEIAGSSTPKK